MHGARRVIMFCLLTAVLPTLLLVIPLYLRHSVYADVTYVVAESDVVEIDDGISTVFCQSHSLRMNSSFHAFQLPGVPELSPNRKHIRLKKSMVLPDDTLEYWGFYLLKGSSVVLSVCSRFEGSRVMVVKGERNLRTCGLFEHKKEGSVTSRMAPGDAQVRVTFETNAQEIHPQPSLKLATTTTTEKPVDEEFEGENLSKEDLDFNNLSDLTQFAVSYVKKHSKFDILARNETDFLNNSSSNVGAESSRHVRHARRKFLDFETRMEKEVQKEEPKKQKKHTKKRNRKDNHLKVERKGGNNVSNTEGSENRTDIKHTRLKRNVGKTHLLDGGVEHGGNAANVSLEDDAESSFSSFENSLQTCYEGRILLNEEFPPSPVCTDVQALETHGTMEAVHDVNEDGYYYYIFYSDNDYVSNDIHAIFNIHKSTFQYANHSRACFNETECTFPISFWSDETVVVEIPTRDGIEHEEDDITYLVSTCHPRMSVYVIFPVAVLFLILGCAFM